MEKDIVVSDTSADTGTWKVSGNNITIILSGDTVAGSFAVSGNTLTITSGQQTEAYIKVSTSSSPSTSTTNSSTSSSSSTGGSSGSGSSSSSSTSTSSSLVGIWKSSRVDSTAYLVEKQTEYVTFSSNGEYSAVEVDYQQSGFLAATIDTSRISGTWSIASDSLYLTNTSKGTAVLSVVLKFSLSGNLLTTIKSSTYGIDTTVFTKATSIVLPTYAARVASTAARTSASSSIVTAARRHFLF